MLPLRVGLWDVLEWDVGGVGGLLLLVLVVVVVLPFRMNRKSAYEKHDDEKKDFEEGVKVICC